jgi:KpsF/GutQ family protein
MNKVITNSIQSTLRLESEALQELLRDYNEQTVEEVVNLIINCKGKIVISGCGTSGQAARKIGHTLCCIECPAVFLTPSDAVHGGLGAVQEDDVVILLSKGGETREINSLLEPVHRKRAIVIGVTENEHSELAQKSDIFLKVKVSKESDDFDMLATSSTLAVIALFDAIAIAITRIRGYTKEQFAIIHPGGAVGKKLTRKRLYEEE